MSDIISTFKERRERAYFPLRLFMLSILVQEVVECVVMSSGSLNRQILRSNSDSTIFPLGMSIFLNLSELPFLICQLVIVLSRTTNVL